jgi:DNA-binding PadR family transcriptional regulator
MPDRQAENRSVDVQDILELTQFQTLTLLTVRYHGPSTGIDIKRGMDEVVGEEVVKSRLYTNLTRLVDNGYLNREAINRRADEFSLTTKGEELLEFYADIFDSLDNI